MSSVHGSSDHTVTEWSESKWRKIKSSIQRAWPINFESDGTLFRFLENIVPKNSHRPRFFMSGPLLFFLYTSSENINEFGRMRTIKGNQDYLALVFDRVLWERDCFKSKSRDIFTVKTSFRPITFERKPSVARTTWAFPRLPWVVTVLYFSSPPKWERLWLIYYHYYLHEAQGKRSITKNNNPKIVFWKRSQSQIIMSPTCSASLRSISDIGGLLAPLLSLEATVTAASASACSNVLPLLLLLLMPFTQPKDLKQIR